MSCYLLSTEAGLSSLGAPGVPWHAQILTDQLTLFQPGGTDYARLITTGTPGFSDLPTALKYLKSAAYNQEQFQIKSGLWWRAYGIFKFAKCLVYAKLALIYIEWINHFEVFYF